MSYLWVGLALISAFTLATSDALTKRALTRCNEYLAAFSRQVFSLPLLLGLWLVVPTPSLNTTFYRAFGLALPLEILSIVLYIKALNLSPLSLTLPFLAITPVSLIFISYLIAGERVSLWGGIGISLIAAGSYILNIHKIKKGICEPFMSIRKERGSVFMIGVALIYGVTSSLGKVAIENSSPLFFAITYYTVMTFFFAPIALWMGRNEINTFIRGRQFKGLVFPGILLGVMVITHVLAIKLAKVAYMISVKRLSLIIGIIYGHLLFKEKNIKERLLGAILMFIGFVMVVTAA